MAAASPAIASSFEDALTVVYENNPHIRAERQRLEATDEGINQATAGFRPTINGQYEYGRQRTSFGGVPWTYGEAQVKELSVTQPLFRGGGTWSSYQSALQRSRAGQYSLSSVEQNVMLQTITAYMDIVQNSAILGLARENQDVLAKQLDSTNIRFNVGEATRTDVAQSQSRLADAQASVTNARGQLDNAIAAFTRVAGYRPEGTLTVPSKMPDLPVSLDDALERGRAANPQLLSALHVAKASQYDVRTNEAAILPKVDLVGALSRQDGAGANGLSDFKQDRVVVQVNIPLYQAGSEYSRVREAEATARQRDHESIDQRMAVDEQIAQAWQQLDTSRTSIGMRQDQIRAAQAAVEGVRKEQEYGARTVRDVLDAEAELFSARTSLARAQRDDIVASYNLAYTLGQLTPQNLGLNVTPYDPAEHESDVKWKPIGF